jgi:salicylate hydroxylase
LIDRPPESRWSRSRMTLLGDAAHPMLPFLAQGASQAIEDADVLADTLITASPLKIALARYETARIRQTSRIQRAARRQGEIYHLSGIAAQMRNLVLANLPSAQLIERFAWIYDHGRP